MSDTVSRKVHKALKLRIYPSGEQKVILNKTFGCCRVVYNERLAEHINYYSTYKDNPNKPKFKGTLPKELRETKFPWLNENTIAEALIRSQRNCEQAYSNFFKSLKKQRKGKKVAFGSEEYSKEELVAEIGAATLVNMIGLESDKSFKNSVSYIQSWIGKLKNDKNLIVSASSRAEKAVNYILGI